MLKKSVLIMEIWKANQYNYILFEANTKIKITNMFNIRFSISYEVRWSLILLQLFDCCLSLSSAVFESSSFTETK